LYLRNTTSNVGENKTAALSNKYVSPLKVVKIDEFLQRVLIRQLDNNFYTFFNFNFFGFCQTFN